MTTENKLIAEFMGKTDLITENQFLSMEHKSHNPTIIEYLKYDTDWNWLMEVVEKCLIGEAETNRPDLIKNIYEGLTDINKQKTYSAVVEFINYYKTL